MVDEETRAEITFQLSLPYPVDLRGTPLLAPGKILEANSRTVAERLMEREGGMIEIGTIIEATPESRTDEWELSGVPGKSFMSQQPNCMLVVRALLHTDVVLKDFSKISLGTVKGCRFGGFTVSYKVLERSKGKGGKP